MGDVVVGRRIPKWSRRNLKKKEREEDASVRRVASSSLLSFEDNELDSLAKLNPTTSNSNHDRLGPQDSTEAQLGRLTDPVLPRFRVQSSDDGNDWDLDLRRKNERWSVKNSSRRLKQKAGATDRQRVHNPPNRSIQLVVLLRSVPLSRSRRNVRSNSSTQRRPLRRRHLPIDLVQPRPDRDTPPRSCSKVRRVSSTVGRLLREGVRNSRRG